MQFKFYHSLLTGPWSVSNMYTCSSGQGPILYKSCATHRAPISFTWNMSCAMWYKGLLSYNEVWQCWNCIWYGLISLDRTINQWRRVENWSTQRKLWTTGFWKCHVLKPWNSSPNWDSYLRFTIGGRHLIGKQACSPLHHVLLLLWPWPWDTRSVESKTCLVHFSHVSQLIRMKSGAVLKHFNMILF